MPEARPRKPSVVQPAIDHGPLAKILSLSSAYHQPLGFLGTAHYGTTVLGLALHIGPSCSMCGFFSAWEDGWVAAEGEHCQGNESVGVLEPERDPSE